MSFLSIFSLHLYFSLLSKATFKWGQQKQIKTSKRATTSKCYDSLKQYTAGFFFNERKQNREIKYYYYPVYFCWNGIKLVTFRFICISSEWLVPLFLNAPPLTIGCLCCVVFWVWGRRERFSVFRFHFQFNFGWVTLCYYYKDAVWFPFLIIC